MFPRFPPRVAANPVLPAALASAIRTAVRTAVAEAMLDGAAAEAASTASAATPKDYEARAVELLPGWLWRRCGLIVVPGVPVRRMTGEIFGVGSIPSFEWDFRAPVLSLRGDPQEPRSSSTFVIYPSRDAFVRALPHERRVLSPLKVGVDDIAVDGLAVFEVTTSHAWATKRSGNKSLLQRLEERLFISLERAKSIATTDHATLTILDVISVVGIVTPHALAQAVATQMTGPAYPLLRVLMDSGRFVCMVLPFEGGAGRTADGSVAGGSAGAAEDGGVHVSGRERRRAHNAAQASAMATQVAPMALFARPPRAAAAVTPP